MNVKYISALIFVIFLVPKMTLAQFGVRVHYDKNNYDDWSRSFNTRYDEDKQLFSNGLGVGLDYWFRLKNRRVEFLPEISLRRANTQYSGVALDKVSQWRTGFTFHTQIYALDFEGDCNCPTFSKQGAGIDKGFFFMLSPGIEMENSKLEMNPVLSGIPEVTKTSNLVGRLGIGLGLDLGISDYFTLTPMVAYYFYSPFAWEKLEPTTRTGEFTDSVGSPTQLEASIRLGFRQDYKKSRRR